MKKILYTLLLILVLTVFCTQIPAVEAKESAAGISFPKKARCDVGLENAVCFEVSLTDKTDVVDDLKFSGKNLQGIVSGYNLEGKQAVAEITFYVKKAGNYEITFSVCKADGTKIRDCKVKVEAIKGYYTSLFKSVTLDGTKCTLKPPYADSRRYINQRYGDTGSFESYYLYNGVYEAVTIDTAKNSAAVKFTLKSGLKIKKIRLYQYDKDAEQPYVLKKFTNGQRVEFRQCTATLGTFFEITYQDSFDQQNHICLVSVNKENQF